MYRLDSIKTNLRCVVSLAIIGSAQHRPTKILQSRVAYLNVSVDNFSFFVSHPVDSDNGLRKIVRVRSLGSDANVFRFGTDVLLILLLFDFRSIRILYTIKVQLLVNNQLISITLRRQSYNTYSWMSLPSMLTSLSNETIATVSLFIVGAAIATEKKAMIIT